MNIHLRRNDYSENIKTMNEQKNNHNKKRDDQPPTHSSLTTYLSFFN
jgi:hypothetical protein